MIDNHSYSSGVKQIGMAKVFKPWSISKLKAVDFIYFHFLFSFSFDLFFIFLFLELRVRVRVMISYCHTLVTSDDMVTVTVTGHMIHGRT